MFLVFAIALIFPFVSAIQPIFNGTWILDLGASDSSYPMLIAMGMPAFKARIASRLIIHETYLVTRRSASIHRVVTPYTNTETSYVFNTPKIISDQVLGTGVAMMQMNENRLLFTYRRTNDGATFYSAREILSSGKLRTMMNFSSSVSQGSFTHYYNRQ